MQSPGLVSRSQLQSSPSPGRHNTPSLHPSVKPEVYQLSSRLAQNVPAVLGRDPHLKAWLEGHCCPELSVCKLERELKPNTQQGQQKPWETDPRGRGHHVASDACCSQAAGTRSWG
ncbi:hypothetical protein H1C71_024817 [Ictidomys tridecemlineatus]|nr:hypothetical protein H1C71_024817 [Ictidomys tridecemlineatus]